MVLILLLKGVPCKHREQGEWRGTKVTKQEWAEQDFCTCLALKWGYVDLLDLLIQWPAQVGPVPSQFPQ